MSKVFCISAGQVESKKKNHSFSIKHRYLNYGLLKIASILGDHKYEPIVLHGLFNLPNKTFELCKNLGIHNEATPVLISIPSFFALEWAKEFSALIKDSFPKKKIIVGGRWVIGSGHEWIKKYLDVDLVIPGVVGKEIVGLVSSLNLDTIKSNINTSRTYVENKINYEYLHDRHLFQPSIEVSSGCGMGCSFCEEKSIPLSKLKSASLVASEMKSIEVNDGLVEISPYLESSMFVATEKWATDLILERSLIGLDSMWRVETRVDKLKPKNIHSLAKAGLKVIDLGLESASHLQLNRMNKTDNPQKYLDAASELIKTAHDNGIWVKVNVLLYPGETYKSLDETLFWLRGIKDYIKGVSVGPVIVYGVDDEAERYIRELERYKSKPVSSGLIGVTYLDLSSEIDYEESVVLSKEISREFMSGKDFFDLKSFSYFSREYRYSNFLSDLKGVSQSDVSFKL